MAGGASMAGHLRTARMLGKDRRCRRTVLNVQRHRVTARTVRGVDDTALGQRVQEGWESLTGPPIIPA